MAGVMAGDRVTHTAHVQPFLRFVAGPEFLLGKTVPEVLSMAVLKTEGTVFPNTDFKVQMQER